MNLSLFVDTFSVHLISVGLILYSKACPPCLICFERTLFDIYSVFRLFAYSLYFKLVILCFIFELYRKFVHLHSLNTHLTQNVTGTHIYINKGLELSKN